jgi:aminopeptidase
VSSTKPLCHNGTVIDNIRVRFAEGKIVEAYASAGQDVLRELIAVDEGACRLGEVALVPHSSPISASGLLFFNTLFDENAACHIAMGQAYAKCVRDGLTMSKDELALRGANTSLIHVDWMIGSDCVDVDGIDADGNHEPLMRKGEWV